MPNYLHSFISYSKEVFASTKLSDCFTRFDLAHCHSVFLSYAKIYPEFFLDYAKVIDQFLQLLHDKVCLIFVFNRLTTSLSVSFHHFKSEHKILIRYTHSLETYLLDQFPVTHVVCSLESDIFPSLVSPPN